MIEEPYKELSSQELFYVSKYLDKLKYSNFRQLLFYIKFHFDEQFIPDPASSIKEKI